MSGAPIVGAALAGRAAAGPSGDDADRVIRIIARRRGERHEPERTPPDIELAAER